MIVYAAVRMVDGEEIPAKLSARPTRERVQGHCDWVKKFTPDWDRKNPVVRIARFQCEEI